MRDPKDTQNIRSAGSGVNRNSVNKKRQGSSVSLPITMWSDLSTLDDALLFNEHIKGTSVSKIVELALTQLFENETPDNVAKRIANDIRKLCR